FQIDGNYMENKFDPSGGKDRWVFGTANVVFGFPVSETTRIRPYLIGGRGIYSVKAKFDHGTSGGSEAKFGLKVGAVCGLNFQSTLGVLLAARFHNVFTEGSNPKFVPINAGIRFYTK